VSGGGVSASSIVRLVNWRRAHLKTSDQVRHNLRHCHVAGVKVRVSLSDHRQARVARVLGHQQRVDALAQLVRDGRVAELVRVDAALDPGLLAQIADQLLNAG
jgi:hypothetical protein